MSIDNPILYAQGALSAQDYLRQTQMHMKMHRQFEPHTLRFQYQFHVKDKARDYQAGFMDAIGAYMLTTLDGVTVDLYRWEVLQVLDRVNRKKK